MLTKRIIPCLDVKNGKVVKGVQFKNHKIIGDPIKLASKYSEENADELVFYDVYSSVESKSVSLSWVNEIAQNINIPFCVAGGIKNIKKAKEVLHMGADKVSINTPAVENPKLISELAKTFGSQCVVIGIDSYFDQTNYIVYAKTGSAKARYEVGKNTLDWVKEVQDRGAGEIVLNCINRDGVKEGYDIDQLTMIREVCKVPLIASGGAGKKEHFKKVFENSNVDGALAASIFHDNDISISELKSYLKDQKIKVRK
ncbi:MAG: imidazole glycerol phosphate synthase subunit HisF [Balneola sp.]|nr:imidazole glycerol phosphate synthase subunit HisF [Balneola sp.]|tara:strand:+ start:1078 stop:1845 length:768 start_codon:yes stop_codon:yes gene_type:complete